MFAKMNGQKVCVAIHAPLMAPYSPEVPVQEHFLQNYKERVERLSQQNRLSKFCTDAGFLTTVEVGQHFMTKDTEEFSQFTDSVACREYTLPRDENSTEPKGWIRGNTKIGPVLEVATFCLQGKYGVEIRIESVNKDNSHSWVRISHGLIKLVTDLSNKEYDDNEQETSEMKSEEFALKTNVLAFASRSKAKAKPRRRTSACSSTRTVPICERSWTRVEPGTYSLIVFPVSKRLTTLLRHGHLPREEDGAIEFWRLKDGLRYEFENSQHWSDEMWKGRMAGGGGHKKRFHYCTDSSGQEILYLRALQGHSGRNPIDPSLQDNVLIPDNFFDYIYHIGCAITGLIPGGQNLGKERQTVFFTAVNPMNKEHKDPYEIDFTAPRLAWYKQWKRHQDTVLGRYTNCSTERIEVLSNKIERNHPLRHTPSLLYLESSCDGIWRDYIRESIYVTSTSSKDFF